MQIDLSGGGIDGSLNVAIKSIGAGKPRNLFIFTILFRLPTMSLGDPASATYTNTMQTNILWTGIEYYSLENCIVDLQDSVIINSTIVGLYNEKIYKVDYLIKLTGSWETYYCFVKSQFNDQIKILEFAKNENKWSLNGNHVDNFEGCTDVDIPLTPFTNSLPINRLKLSPGQEEDINVIYIDILEDSITHVPQRYRRISTEVYNYQNIPNDFEAEIKVDREGFVIDYPKLFVRTAKVQSNYR